MKANLGQIKKKTIDALFFYHEDINMRETLTGINKTFINQ